MNYMIKLFIMIVLTGIIILTGLFIFMYYQSLQYNYGNFYMGKDDYFGYPTVNLCEWDTLDKSPDGYSPGRFFTDISFQGKISNSFGSGGTAVIYPYVLDAKSDKEFLLVSQKPLDCLNEYKKREYMESNNIFNSHPNDYDIDKALRRSKKVQYWIIKKAKYEIYGPLSKSEYIQMKKKLKVPKELKLDFEKK